MHIFVWLLQNGAKKYEKKNNNKNRNIKRNFQTLSFYWGKHTIFTKNKNTHTIQILLKHLTCILQLIFHMIFIYKKYYLQEYLLYIKYSFFITKHKQRVTICLYFRFFFFFLIYFFLFWGICYKMSLFFPKTRGTTTNTLSNTENFETMTTRNTILFFFFFY